MDEEKLDRLREKLDAARQPLIFFDDDCDGLASFLQVYKHVGDGHGVPVKDSPGVEERHARFVEEYQPDVVIVLDKPYVTDAFLDAVGQEVVWVDHHEPQHPPGNVLYCNPRVSDDSDNRPTSYWLYRALQEHLWIAMVGIVGDWSYPDDLAPEFRTAYPGLLPEEITTPEAAIHDSRLGDLVRVLNFNLKGKVEETMRSIRALQRVDGPEEILDQSSEHGTLLYEKYSELAMEYQRLKATVEAGDERVLVFTYVADTTSFTGELSNELLYEYPEKVILVGRRDKDRYKCSLRSSDVDIASILERCLERIEGRGGGHTHACGASVSVDDFDRFVDCLRERVANVRSE